MAKVKLVWQVRSHLTESVRQTLTLYCCFGDKPLVVKILLGIFAKIDEKSD